VPLAQHIAAEEVCPMRCSMCGSLLKPAVTDLPFKVRETAIVILRGLPVLQCPNCPEYQIEDQVFARVEALLADVAATAELEVIRYAA
jgi:YgiT-type zinc finger domain-containing protein